MLEGMGALEQRLQGRHPSDIVHPGWCRYVATAELSGTTQADLMHGQSDIVSGIGMVHAFAVSPNGQEIYDADITNWFMAFGALTCISNIYCVAAISYKAWFVNKQLLSSG